MLEICMIGVLLLIFFKLLLPCVFHHLLCFKGLLLFFHLRLDKGLLHGFSHFLILKNWVLESRFQGLLCHCLFLFGILESVLHGGGVMFDLFDLLAMNNHLALLNSFQEVKELGVLKPWIWVVHHGVQHWLRTVKNVFLFLFVSYLCFFEGILHEGLVFPWLSFLLKLNLFELLIEHVFFDFHSLLGLHPLVMVHHLHFLLQLLLLDHWGLKLLVHHARLLSIHGI